MNTVQAGKINSLYLTYDGLTDPLGQSQILPYLLGLEERGIVFHIISFEKPERFADNEHEIRKLIKGREIHWYPLTYHKKPPVLSTLYDLRNLSRTSKNLIKKHPIQVVHCRSYLTSLVGLKLKMNYGKRFLFDMRGFWADERFEGKIWNTNNPIFKLIYSYFKRREIDFFENADAIISLTDNAKEEIQNILSVNQPESLHKQINKSTNQQITTIPCCTDLELFNSSRILPTWKSELSKALRGNFDLKLIYIGSLGTWYMLDEMLDFYKSLISENACQLILLTNDLIIAEQRIAELGWTEQIRRQIFQRETIHYSYKQFPTSEIVITNTARSFVPYFIDYSDASLLFIKPSFSKKASSATKMGEVLALNKPVITNSNWGDVEVFAGKSNSVILIREFSTAHYMEAGERLTKLLKSEKPDALRFAQDHLSLKNGIEKYYNVYRELSS